MKILLAYVVVSVFSALDIQIEYKFHIPMGQAMHWSTHNNSAHNSSNQFDWIVLEFWLW